MRSTQRNTVTVNQREPSNSKNWSPSKHLLELRDVTRDFRSKDGSVVRAVNRVGFRLGAGEFVCAVGPSGCGKTTLLKLIAGLIQPTSGRVYFDGEPVKAPRHDVGIVFQKPVLLPWKSVIDNVLVPVAVGQSKDRSYDKKDVRERAKELLRLVGLGATESKYPGELSGGMQQRVAIARSLIRSPRALLMDEPFGALDAITRETMSMELLRIFSGRDKAVFFITHSISEAVFLGDRVLVMSSDGEINHEVRVDLGRPRALDMMGSARFGELTNEIRSLLGV